MTTTHAKSIEERFWSKVDRSDDCWIWTAFTDPAGYGRFEVLNKARLAHRVAYTLTKGPIPEGECVLHTCDNPPCVNPDHLWLGTQKENIKDRDQKERQNNMKKVSCAAGHLLIGDNLYTYPRTGKRECRECRRAQHRKYYKKAIDKIKPVRYNVDIEDRVEERFCDSEACQI